MNQILLESGAVLPIAGRVAVTVQDNDLTKPESVQATFSTDFTLPDTAEVRGILEHAQVGTSASNVPYAELRGALVAGGVEVLPRAVVQIRDYEEGTGFGGIALGGNKDFYATLGDKSLRDLDLSDFDHNWVPVAVQAAAARTVPDGWPDGYTYDLYDRGRPVPAEGGTITLTHGVWPSVWARLLWERIIAGAGVRWSGALPAQFDRELLPATEPFGYSQQTQGDNVVRMGLRWGSHVRKGDWGADTVPYGYTATGPFIIAAGITWDTDVHEAIIGLRGYYRLYASISMAMSVGIGWVRFYISLEVNGAQVAEQWVETSNSVGPQLISVEHGRILLAPGDQVRVRVRGPKSNVTTDPRWFYPILEGQFWPGFGPITPPLPDDYPGHNGQKFTIELLNEFPVGGRIRLIDWLPDITQRDFVNSVLARYGLTQQADPYADEVRFRLTAPVVATAPLDWSERVDASVPPKREWLVGDYTRRNRFAWQPDATNPPEAVGLGDGVLLSAAGPDEVKDAAVQPFAATPTADGLPLVRRWRARPGTAPVEYDEVSPEPRLVLLSFRRRQLLVDDGYGNDSLVPFFISEFATPAGDDLDFARTLLPTYYPHLAAVLRRPLLLRLNVRLSAAEFVAFSQLVPVWLEREGHAFYVNKIEQFEADAPSTAVELLRFTPA